MSVLIDKLDRGYIVTSTRSGGLTSKKAYLTIDEVFVDLLSQFEGLCPYFNGRFFGDIKVIRSKVDAEGKGS